MLDLELTLSLSQQKLNQGIQKALRLPHALNLVDAAICRAQHEHSQLLSLFTMPSDEWTVSIMNALIADSLQLICDEVANDPYRMQSILKHHAKSSDPLPAGLYFSSLLEKKTIRAFEGILSEKELGVLFSLKLKEYVLLRMEELNMAIDTFHDKELIAYRTEIQDLGDEAKAKVFFELILPKIEKLR